LGGFNMAAVASGAPPADVENPKPKKKKKKKDNAVLPEEPRKGKKSLPPLDAVEGEVKKKKKKKKDKEAVADPAVADTKEKKKKKKKEEEEGDDDDEDDAPGGMAPTMVLFKVSKQTDSGSLKEIIEGLSATA